MGKVFFRLSVSVLRSIIFFKLTKVIRNFSIYNERVSSQDYSKHRFDVVNGGLYSGLSLFGLFLKSQTQEDKLLAAIKRSILFIQREQYDKAEQMLHIALRMAQDIQSSDGIIYVFDIMANLAMQRGQFEKAEKLFADVMRRLLTEGFPIDSPKILHISSKIAHMAQMKGDLEKAKIGFIWTLAKIEDRMKRMPDDNDVKELWALTINWFGQLHMKENNFKQARQCFKDAYEVLLKIHGTVNEEFVTLLNNLGVACTNMENLVEARYYMLEALRLVENMEDKSQKGILQANLGVIYLREGLTNQAKISCSLAWKAGNDQKNIAAIEQAEYCLNEIKVNAYQKSHCM